MLIRRMTKHKIIELYVYVLFFDSFCICIPIRHMTNPVAVAIICNKVIIDAPNHKFI
jgi:hypothetical protein